MAIDTWITVTYNTATNANPRATAVAAAADGGAVTLAYDSAIATTQDRLRVMIAAAFQNAAGRLPGP